MDVHFRLETQNVKHDIAVADNPVFLETERLIARCIHRQAAEVDLDLELAGEEEEGEGVGEGVTSAPDPDLSRLLRPAPVSTCPSPASSEGGVYTSVSCHTSI